MSSTELPPTIKEEKTFALTVVDNFDLNIGTFHGDNSIHILNRKIIQTPNYKQIIIDVIQYLEDTCNLVAADVQSIHLNAAFIDRMQSAARATDKMIGEATYQPFTDNAYNDILLVYSLMKRAFAQSDVFTKIINNRTTTHIPLLSSLLAIFIKVTPHILSKITFLLPINQDSSTLSTSKLCIEAMSLASKTN